MKKKTRKENMTKDTQRQFTKYNKENPVVYRKFKKYAKQLFRNGRRRYSAWAIVNAIRWEQDFTTRGNKFKINNDFIALLSRKLAKEDKAFKGFFNTKPLKQRSDFWNT